MLCAELKVFVDYLWLILNHKYSAYYATISALFYLRLPKWVTDHRHVHNFTVEQGSGHTVDQITVA